MPPRIIALGNRLLAFPFGRIQECLMNQNLFSRLVTFVATGLAASLARHSVSASAAVTTYTTRASFDAAVGPTSSVNFNSYVVNTPFHTVAIDVGPFTLSMIGSPDTSYNFIDVAPPNSAETDVNGTTNMRVFTDNNPPGDLLFTFDSPIYAFGADFRSLNDVELRTQILVAGDNLVPPVQPSSGMLTFYGFKSTTPFTTITFHGVANDVYGADNVSFGGVPEPSTLALVAGSMLGVMGRRKRDW